MSDRQTLVEMGFAENLVSAKDNYSDQALKATKNAGLQPAMDWIIANPEGLTQEEIPSEEATAQSLLCQDCGKIFKDAAAAEFHAVKSGHLNFSESTEAIKPLTEEERKQKMAELDERLKKRREEKRQLEIQEEKNREKVRRATAKEIQENKEKFEQMEMQKAFEERRKEKEQDRLAKERIKALLEQDRLERLAKKGVAVPTPVAATVQAPTVQVVQPDYSQARIQIRLPNATLTHTFQATQTMADVYNFVRENSSNQSIKLMQTFPRKVVESSNLTLKELGFVPSAAFISQ